MRSVLDIGFSTRVPQQNATIPYGYYANGAPFALYSQGEITSFKIVCLRTRIETELSKTIILSEDSKQYYKATHDLGVPRGSYFYKLGIGEVSTGGDPIKGDVTSTTDSAGALNTFTVDSVKNYGVWDFDVEYKYDKYFSVDFISDALGSSFRFDIAPTYFYVTLDGVEIFGVLFSELDADQRFKLTIKRNETLDQYFTGAADAMAFYFNDALIDDAAAWVGSNPLINSAPIVSEKMAYEVGYDLTFYGTDLPIMVTNGSWNTIVTEYSPAVTEGGSKLYSQVFKIDEHMRGPTPEVGDFSSSDFNNDFLNFEATGVIDENGDEC